LVRPVLRSAGAEDAFPPPSKDSTMSLPLQPGDRVRVTIRNRMAGCRPGDKGTVLRASVSAATGGRYYTVAMDKDGPGHNGAVFTEGEVEADPAG
jgi:hypothetical protein